MRVHFGDCVLDSDARELRRGAERIHLSPKAFRLLEMLIDERPAAVSKQRLFDTIWPGTFVAESNLASIIKEIRLALNDDARHPTLIRTVFRHGYAFSGDAVVESTPQSRVDSLAVLPFANASGTEWDYFADGLAEALRNALVRRFGSLRIVPRSTSFRYRSRDVDLRAAAREMRVDLIVTGSVSVRDDALSVQVELVNAKADSQIWGGRLHSRTSELLQIQRRIESEVSSQIAQSTGAEDSGAASRPADNEEAYELFLRGTHLLNRRDAEGFRRAIEALRRATQLEPSYAAAHAALAEVYVALASRDLHPPAEIFPLAREAAERALAIDPSIAAAHTAMAGVHELYDWNWSQAEEVHRTAVSMQPRDATAAHWFALHYARRGLHEAARDWIVRALALEPLSGIINTNAALIAYLAHDFAAAVRHSETALELAPHFEAARVVNGVACIQVDPKRAIEELQEAARLSGRQPYSLAPLASAYAADGQGPAAHRIRDEIAASAATGYVSGALIAIVEIAVGNLNAALDALERAARDRSPWLSYLLSEPRVDVLRGEPRFRSLLATIGLAR